MKRTALQLGAPTDARLMPVNKPHRVGSPLGQEEYEKALEEAGRRVKLNIPPGFLDAEKDDSSSPDGAVGDYLVWLQSYKEARQRQLQLVLVTGDEKADWWWKHRGQFLGPRAELVNELYQETSLKLIMLRPAQLIEHATALKLEIDADVESDVARGTEPEKALWTEKAVSTLLGRLDDEGMAQAEVIRHAGLYGGSISREQIFKICKYSPNRMLRGFTRPANRVTSELQLQGILDEAVKPMLTPDYENGPTALSFSIPDEVIGILQRSASSMEDDV